MPTRITTEHRDDLAVLTLDDGKVNAFDRAWFDELDAALDGAAEAAGVVLVGRPGMFSAGLNTRVMAGMDAEGMQDLLVAFGRTMHRVWLEPRPVVAAVTGHAVAGGTILALCADHAVAAAGDFRWGLTETSIGFVLPSWTVAIARGNVPAHRLDDLLLPGASVDPARAVEVGFADVLAEPDAVLDAALEHARVLTALPLATYGAQKQRLRGKASQTVLADVEADVAAALAAGR